MCGLDLTRANVADMVREVEDKLGAVDILVNSAGAARRYLPEELDAALGMPHGPKYSLTFIAWTRFFLPWPRAVKQRR